MINIGFGNTVISYRVVAVVVPGSAPMKRLRERATQADRLIDATHGRKTRSIIVTDSNTSSCRRSTPTPCPSAQRQCGARGRNAGEKDT